MLFVGERRRSRRAHRAIRVQLLRSPSSLSADRAVSPPTSSSLADEKHVRSLRAHCSLRSLRLTLRSRCLPHSLADEKRVCLLNRPGQRRASLAQHGGARSEFDCSARQARCV